MSTVCVVIEHWSNCERNEDFTDGFNLLAIAGNSTIAEDVVQKRKAELLELAKNHSGAVTEIEDLGCYFDGIIIEWDAYVDCPTETYNFGQEEYYWEIKDYKILEEP